jgi:hypothetical protein
MTAKRPGKFRGVFFRSDLFTAKLSRERFFQTDFNSRLFQDSLVSWLGRESILYFSLCGSQRKRHEEQ